ncbi:hypothetical protein F5887DRAFT_1071708 [Amanita rubescens]|nr:hypothetical protein F5887DRAFT_1071708 [Amanita rubescens]
MNTQVAKEASWTPFDQRSLVQRWAVREATRDGFLPLDDATAEPDVEQLASKGSLPGYIHHNLEGCYNIHDITVWLFITMTQPDPVEGTVAWYWELACSLLSMRGRFGEIISPRYRLDDYPPNYLPRRFVREGEYRTQDVAYHLHACGLTSRDANTLFHDFTNNYRDRQPTVAEPNWATVPAPRPRVSRPSLSQRRKKKGGKTASNYKTLAERLGGSAPHTGGTSNVLIYDEAPPAEDPLVDTEMSNTQNEQEQGEMESTVHHRHLWVLVKSKRPSSSGRAMLSSILRSFPWFDLVGEGVTGALSSCLVLFLSVDTIRTCIYNPISAITITVTVTVTHT